MLVNGELKQMLLENCKVTTHMTTDYTGDKAAKYSIELVFEIPGGKAVYQIVTLKATNDSLENAAKLGAKH